MEASIEMKIVVLDQMLEVRKQLIEMQEGLGMYNGLDLESTILIYSPKEFIEYSKAVGADFAETGYKTDEGNREIAFEYKGMSFNTYVYPEEYELYKEELSGGIKNA